MTKEEFKTFWAKRFPKSRPISYTFRHDYPDRWFRIHSLPESKRYPNDEQEWATLLIRQNSIITDILGDNSKILIVTGDHHFEGYTEVHPIEDVDSIKRFSFCQLDDIDLNKLKPEEFESGQIFRPMFCTSVWSTSQFDDVLRDIAQDAVRVFFISIVHDTVVIPYDGGVDLIMKDAETRDKYKSKYRSWLSGRDDGL